MQGDENGYSRLLPAMGSAPMEAAPPPLSKAPMARRGLRLWKGLSHGTFCLTPAHPPWCLQTLRAKRRGEQRLRGGARLAWGQADGSKRARIRRSSTQTFSSPRQSSRLRSRRAGVRLGPTGKMRSASSCRCIRVMHDASDLQCHVVERMMVTAGSKQGSALF